MEDKTIFGQRRLPYLRTNERSFADHIIRRAFLYYPHIIILTQKMALSNDLGLVDLQDDAINYCQLLARTFFKSSKRCPTIDNSDACLPKTD